MNRHSAINKNLGLENMKMGVQMWVLWVVMLIQWAWAGTRVTAASLVAKPGCPERCGNVSVPYPFGIRDSKCAKEMSFLLNCSHTGNSAELFNMYGRRVVNIELLRGTTTVIIETVYACSDENSSQMLSYSFSMEGSPFTVSDTRNEFIVIGCHMSGYLYDSGVHAVTSCNSTCDKPVIVTDNASCIGQGCCQTKISKDLKIVSMDVRVIVEHNSSWQYNPCGYAFLAAQDVVDISKISLWDKIEDSQVVLDWVISEETCEEAAQNQSSYSCGHNTLCSDSSNGPGHRCLCKEGYEGNPYLPQGCQDIDECQDPKRYPCEGTCKNTPGNYTCRCPLGMHGDRKVGCKGLRVSTLAAGIGLSMGLLLVLAVLLWLYRGMKKKRQIKLKKNFYKQNGGLLLQQQISSSKGKLERTKLFSAEELEKATDNYHENRILGRGGQGTVYKGMLTDGTIVAVKKSGKMNEGQTQQFINEVVLLSQINHRHIVKLIGCCLETQVPLLVYEFISNGTLSNHIHGQVEEFPFKWSHRLRIAKEVAGAIAYMHSTAYVPIYHRDIKSSNILLDEKYRAKVSDFGIARSVPMEKSHLTTLVQGTFGYLDPEYFQSSQFTEKSDVYSFGVVLVELLTGRKPISSTIGSGEERGLAAQFISSMNEDRLFEVLDPQVVMEGEKEELIMVANLATRCLKLHGNERPTMSEVALELECSKKSRENLPVEQNYQEGDHFNGEASGGWNASSTQSLTGR